MEAQLVTRSVSVSSLPPEVRQILRGQKVPPMEKLGAALAYLVSTARAGEDTTKQERAIIERVRRMVRKSCPR